MVVAERRGIVFFYDARRHGMQPIERHRGAAMDALSGVIKALGLDGYHWGTGADFYLGVMRRERGRMLARFERLLTPESHKGTPA